MGTERYSVWQENILTREYIRFFLVHSFQWLLFPAAGYRNGYDGHVNNVGWGCYAWSASPYSATSQNGGFLNTNSSWVNPVNNTNRSNAFPVRCVRELTGLNFVCMRRRRVFWGVSSHHPHFILRILVAGWGCESLSVPICLFESFPLPSVEGGTCFYRDLLIKRCNVYKSLP